MSVAYPVPTQKKIQLRYAIYTKPHVRYLVPTIQAYATRAFATVALFRYAVKRGVEPPITHDYVSQILQEEHDYYIKPITGAEAVISVKPDFDGIQGSISKTTTVHYDVVIPEAVEFDAEAYRRLVEAQSGEWTVWADRVSKMADDEVKDILAAAAEGYARFLSGRYPEHLRAVVKQRLNILSVDPQYYKESLQKAKEKWARGLLDRVAKVAVRSREISQPAVAASYDFVLAYINAL